MLREEIRTLENKNKNLIEALSLSNNNLTISENEIKQLKEELLNLNNKLIICFRENNIMKLQYN